MDTTLVIMAAGIGSRFGGGIKQLEKMGPNGEIIMDYSIYDAVRAGFNKVVFIIRKGIEKDFKEIVGDRISKVIKTEYVYQELDRLPDGYCVPSERTKPWGTGHAVLMCRDVVKEPFAVINADDFYGEEPYRIIHDELVNPVKSGLTYDFCMAGFRLGNTLSDNGTVTRGICVADSDGYLQSVCETGGIRNVDGEIVHDDNGRNITATPESCVSMNMWGLTPGFFDELEPRFRRFLDNIPKGDVKKEFFLPTVVDELIREKLARVRVLPTDAKWFGVTYREDKPMVVNSIKKLIEQGVYPRDLWA